MALHVGRTTVLSMLVVGIFAVPNIAFAQVCSASIPCPSPSTQRCNAGVCEAISSGSTGGGLFNPLGTTDLEGLVLKILAFIIRIGAIVIIFMLVYVGFLFVTERGEPAKLTVARQALLWTVVGALILLGSQAIALAIQATVGAISAGG